MSMEINGRYGRYQSDYAERLNAEQEKTKESGKTKENEATKESGKTKETEAAKESERGQNVEKASDKIYDLQDEYISSERSGAKPTGLYRLEQDENGKKRVFFDDPKKSGPVAGKESPKVKEDHPEKAAEKCTANTDKADREIRELKEKKQRLEQQIQAAAGEEKKKRELEKKLEQVESELRQKDNDTYRRRNTSVLNYS